MEELLSICKTKCGLIVHCETVNESVELFNIIHKLGGDKNPLFQINAIQDRYRTRTCHRIRSLSNRWLYTHANYEWYVYEGMRVFDFDEFSSMAFGHNASEPLDVDDIDITSLF